MFAGFSSRTLTNRRPLVFLSVQRAARWSPWKHFIHLTLERWTFPWRCWCCSSSSWCLIRRPAGRGSQFPAKSNGRMFIFMRYARYLDSTHRHTDKDNIFKLLASNSSSSGWCLPSGHYNSRVVVVGRASTAENDQHWPLAATPCEFISIGGHNLHSNSIWLIIVGQPAETTATRPGICRTIERFRLISARNQARPGDILLSSGLSGGYSSLCRRASSTLDSPRRPSLANPDCLHGRRLDLCARLGRDG